jgi:hypothetical protein
MTTLSKRLDQHFAACTAVAAGAALLGGAEQAQAAVVYSGVVNIPMPGTFLGVYLNMVTGVTGTTAASTTGHDINPYYGGNRIFSTGFNNPGGGINATGPAPSNAINLALGAPVVAPFFFNNPFNTPAQFTVGVGGFVGIRFLNEVTNAQNFGWVRIARAANDTGVGTIIDYAYENTGGAITAGQGAAPVNPCAQPLPPCPADIAPGGGDDLVNTQDLLAVISSWGSVQSPPGTGPRPLGDCAPLPNGDCLVNTQDLLAVIGAWGNCPVPSGRCCAPNGTCSTQTAAACATAGGNYGGDGTTCVGFTCPVLPANDNCAGAITVGNGQTIGDNTNATTSAGVPGGDCIFGGAVNVTDDLWYTYTATCTGRLTVDLCATGGSLTDTTLQLFTGACGSLTEVACDDDSCGDLDNLLSAIIDFDVTAGQVFKIRVGTWGGNPNGGNGPFVLTIGCVVPSDDFCQDATPINSLPATIVGNLATATPDGTPCGAVGAGIGRWYTVSSVTQRNLTASICDSPLGLWDGAISVFCGNNCDGLVCVAADAGDFCAFNPAPVTWCAAAGQTYWILVHAVGGDFSAGGAYELDVTAGAACGSSVVCGAANDECAGATVANVGANAGNNALATTSAGIPGGACTFGGVSNFTRDVWFTHTPAATGTLTIDTCASTGPVTDSVISVFTGACGALTEIGCIDDGCGTGGLLGSIAVPVTSGVPIKIRVGSWNTSPAGTFTLTLTPFTPGSGNDECAGATVVNLGANAGTNATATTTPAPAGSCVAFTRDVWFTHTPAASGNMTIDTCGSTGAVTDSTLAVYSGACGSLAELGCDDDACATPALSSMVTVPVTAGVPIKIRVGSFGTTPAGTFTLNLNMAAPPCTVTCPGGAQIEGEVCATANYVDAVNGGCNSTPPVTTPIIVGQPMCGITSTFVSGAVQSRDTDWYSFNVPATATYHIEINANFTALVGFVAQPCPQTAFVTGSTLVTTAAQACTTVSSPTVSLTGPATYVCFVSTSVFTGFPCGGANQYTVRVVTP